MTTVLVFRTSVNSEQEIQKLEASLNRVINGHGKWNFDLEDCDNILRVETLQAQPREITGLLKTRGFQCEELED